MSYRYEPLGPWVGDYAVMSRGPDFRANQYTAYTLAADKDWKDPNGILQGANVSAGDLDTKNNVCCSTWREIITNSPRANYKSANKDRYITDYLCTNDDFTAQTSLAASYGLFQMMFQTAWEHGLRAHPTALYDTDVNIQSDTNSTYIATRMIELLFAKKYGPSPQLNGLFDLISDFKSVWSKYNTRPGYSDDVANRVPQYRPTAQSIVFGGQQ